MNNEGLFFKSMHHFQEIMYSDDYSVELKEEEFDAFSKDFKRVNDDPLIQDLFNGIVGEWELVKNEMRKNAK